jgi:hypothetical protein
MKTIAEELEDIKRGYTKTTKTRFLYNETDLTQTCNTIICFYLLYRETVGYTIFKCFFRRAVKNISEWETFLRTLSQEILINAILPHLKKDSDGDAGYKFKKFIAWRFPKKNEKNKYSHGKVKFG